VFEVNFKSSSIPENQLVKWGLHQLIYWKLTLSLIDVDFQQVAILNLN